MSTIKLAESDEVFKLIFEDLSTKPINKLNKFFN